MSNQSQEGNGDIARIILNIWNVGYCPLSESDSSTLFRKILEALDKKDSKYEAMLKEQHDIQNGLVRDIQHYKHVAEDVEERDSTIKALEEEVERVRRWASELGIGERVNYRKRYEELIQNWSDGLSGEEQFAEHLKADKAREDAYRDKISELEGEVERYREVLEKIVSKKEDYYNDSWKEIMTIAEQALSTSNNVEKEKS